MVLRPYQKRAIDLIDSSIKKGVKRIGVQMMTGSGKTFIFKEIIKNNIRSGKRTCLITSGNRLLNQITHVFNDLSFGMIWGEKKFNIQNNFLIISAPTYFRNPESYFQFIQNMDYFIIDEAHDCTAPSYLNFLNSLTKEAVILGFSATFIEGSNKKAHTFWGKIIKPVTAKELNKYGVIPDLFIVSRKIDINYNSIKTTSADYNKKDLYDKFSISTLYGSLKKEYEEHNPDGLPAIAFCINIAHTKKVSETLQEIGVITLVIHSKLSGESRIDFNNNLNYCMRNKLKFCIVSVDMLSRGVDIPGLRVGLHLRPTKSKRLFYQQVGRLTRIDASLPKESQRKILIDFTDNYNTLGSPYSDFEPDTVDSYKKSGRLKTPSKTKRCPHCFAINSSHNLDCIVCGGKMWTEVELKEIPAEFEIRKVSFEARDEKVEKAVKKYDFLLNSADYMGFTNSGKWRKIYEKFGPEHFFRSRVVPEEVKDIFAEREVKF